MDRLDILLEISEHAGIFGTGNFTTSRLADDLGISQQGISNALIRLEKTGLIERKPSNRGIAISLTEKGRMLMEDYRKRLLSVLERKDAVTGRVIAGVGQGRYYTEVPGFKRQFRTKLGIDTSPGTLNLKVRPDDKRAFLHDRKPVVIDGFSTKRRSFGWIRCYPVLVKGIRCAVAVPERTVHKHDVMELISDKNLRKELGLVDGSEVEVSWAG